MIAYRGSRFNFDLERMQAAVEGGTIQLPNGLSREQRRAWIRDRLADACREVARRKPD